MEFIRTTVCPVCKTNGVILWKRKGVFQLLRCFSCGLIFIDPSSYPDNPNLQYVNDNTSPTQYYCASAETDKKNFNRTLDALESYGTTKIILDVGANVGTFLNLARQRGWTGIGVEPNATAIRICNEQGLRVYQGFFDEQFARHISQEGIRFDSIHMGDVLEHVFDPITFLKIAYGLLRSGGSLVIVTPNMNHFLTRRYQIKPEEHLVYFNARSLEKALQLAGFSDIKIKPQMRLRSLTHIEKGTTKIGFMEKTVIQLANFSVFEKMIIAILAVIGRDELFAIAKKP